jgi:hypothetical protein
MGKDTRVIYRRRHAYPTKSNRRAIIKTPGEWHRGHEGPGGGRDDSESSRLITSWGSGWVCPMSRVHLCLNTLCMQVWSSKAILKARRIEAGPG